MAHGGFGLPQCPKGSVQAEDTEVPQKEEGDMNASSRHVWSRALVTLICGLTLGLLWVLGGECVPGAQAGAPRPHFFFTKF